MPPNMDVFLLNGLIGVNFEASPALRGGPLWYGKRLWWTRACFLVRWTRNSREQCPRRSSKEENPGLIHLPHHQGRRATWTIPSRISELLWSSVCILSFFPFRKEEFLQWLHFKCSKDYRTVWMGRWINVVTASGEGWMLVRLNLRI